MGVGVLISGGRYDIIADNDIHNNGAWGVLLVPEVDTATSPPIAHCKGGVGLKALSFCYYENWGNEVENNTMSHNGFFGNPSNGDLAEISNLAFPGNCWHGNVAASGRAISAKHFQLGRPGVTSDPPFIQYFPHTICGIPDAGAGIISILSLRARLQLAVLRPLSDYPVHELPAPDGGPDDAAAPAAEHAQSVPGRAAQPVVPHQPDQPTPVSRAGVKRYVTW